MPVCNARHRLSADALPLPAPGGACAWSSRCVHDRTSSTPQGRTRRRSRRKPSGAAESGRPTYMAYICPPPPWVQDRCSWRDNAARRHHHRSDNARSLLFCNMPDRAWPGTALSAEEYRREPAIADSVMSLGALFRTGVAKWNIIHVATPAQNRR